MVKDVNGNQLIQSLYQYAGVIRITPNEDAQNISIDLIGCFGVSTTTTGSPISTTESSSVPSTTLPPTNPTTEMPEPSSTQESTTESSTSSFSPSSTTSSFSESTSSLPFTTPVCGLNMLFGRASSILDIPSDSIYSLDQSGNNKLIIGNSVLGGSFGWTPNSVYKSIYVDLPGSSFVSHFNLFFTRLASTATMEKWR